MVFFFFFFRLVSQLQMVPQKLKIFLKTQASTSSPSHLVLEPQKHQVPNALQMFSCPVLPTATPTCELPFIFTGCLRSCPACHLGAGALLFSLPDSQLVSPPVFHQKRKWSSLTEPSWSKVLRTKRMWVYWEETTSKRWESERFRLQLYIRM